jgi:hypothetical protein
MSGGGCEKTCHIQGQGLFVDVIAFGASDTNWFDFRILTQFNHTVSYLGKQGSIAVFQKIVNEFRLTHNSTGSSNASNAPLECFERELSYLF